MSVQDPTDSLCLALSDVDRFLESESQWFRRTAAGVLQLRVAGYTDREIREELGLSPGELRRVDDSLRAWARTLR